MIRSTRLATRLMATATVVSCVASWTSAAQAVVVKYERKPSSYDNLPAATKGGTLTIRIASNPKVLNPIVSSDANSRAFEPYLFTTLFTEDGDTLQPLPYLAESYEVSADKKSYTFVLNKDAVWQDGTPVTTDDVKFSYDTIMNEKVDAAAIRTYYEGLKIKVLDKHKFVFTVPEGKFDTLRSLYLFQTIQKKQFAKDADFNKSAGIMQPIGNGPYKLKSFDRDQQVVLERKADWWGYKLPHFKNRYNADQIVFRIITDDALAYERFVKGDVDLTTFNQEQFALKVRGTDKSKIGAKAGEKAVWATEIQNKAPRGYSYIGWNMRNPMFASVKTRRALSQIVDYKQIIDKVFHGLVFQSTSPFGSLTFNADPELRKEGKMLTTNRRAALALLKEDGWADTDKDNVLDKTIDGKKVKFSFELKFNSNNPLRAKIAQIVKENFKAAGIEVNVRAMEWNAFLDDVDNRRFDAMILAWTATPYPNPNQTWHTKSAEGQGSNAVGYSNPKVDELIGKANAEFDLQKRALILHEINRLIYEEQPYTFLTEPRSALVGLNSKIKSPSGVWAMTYDVSAPDDMYQYVP
jgi:ABC-type transport system substrate-binding protein